MGKTRVSFGLRAVDLKPQNVSLRLGLEPSRAFARGDKYETHLAKSVMGFRERPHGVWQIRSDSGVVSDNVQDHLDFLLRLLEPKSDQLREILSDEGVYADVRIWVESDELVNSFTLKAASVARIASLCHDINVVVIGVDPVNRARGSSPHAHDGFVESEGG